MFASLIRSVVRAPALAIVRPNFMGVMSRCKSVSSKRIDFADEAPKMEGEAPKPDAPVTGEPKKEGKPKKEKKQKKARKAKVPKDPNAPKTPKAPKAPKVKKVKGKKPAPAAGAAAPAPDAAKPEPAK